MLRIAKAVFLKDYKIAISYKFRFLSSFLLIIFQILVFYFFANFFNSMIDDSRTKVEYFSFVILGICMLDIFMSITSSISLSIEEYKRSGMIEELAAAKNFYFTALSSSIYPILFSFYKLLAYLIFSIIFFEMNMISNSNIIPFLAVFFLLIISSVGIALLSASFAILFYRGGALSTIFSALSVLLAGIHYPISILPEPLNMFSFFLPLYPALELFRDQFGINAFGGGDNLLMLQILILNASIYFLIGSYFFKYVVSVAKRRGDLLHY